MSMTFEEVMDQLKDDPELMGRLMSTESVMERQAMMTEAGIDFEVIAFDPDGELPDSALQNVFGGISLTQHEQHALAAA